MWVRIETKWNERAADSREMRVLPEEKHVPSHSARTKTAFSCSIVPLSFETFTACAMFIYTCNEFELDSGPNVVS